MTSTLHKKTGNVTRGPVVVCLVVMAALAALWFAYPRKPPEQTARVPKELSYQEKKPVDTGGFTAVLPTLDRWPPSASLEEISSYFKGVGFRNIEKIDRQLAQPEFPDDRRIVFELAKASLCSTTRLSPARAYDVLAARLRTWLDERRQAGRAVALHGHLFPGSDRPAPG